MNFWCTESPFHKKSESKRDTKESPCLFGSWSIIHLLVSCLMYSFIIFFCKKISKLHAAIIVIILHSIYELKDLYNSYIIVKYKGNSFINAIGDNMACIFGIYISSLYFKNNDLQLKQLKELTVFVFTIVIIFIIHYKNNKIDEYF